VAKWIGAVALVAVALPLLVIVLVAGHQGCGGTEPAAAGDIPASYLRLYELAGDRYGVAWPILAGIGKIESDHGRSRAPGVHSGANGAGAMGPMQFLGGTWAAYGDGGDVYDPADAIPAAARYLRASGAPAHTYQAIFAYNHADWYVQQVYGAARRYAASVIGLNDSDTGEGCFGAAGVGGVAGKVIGFARAQLGKPYIWGGTGPAGFDCSGLTLMAYRSAGIAIPRLANDQYFDEPHVAAGAEQPGDLVFFAGSDGTATDPGHVGIVVDPARGLMIVAPHTGTDIQYQSYKSYPGGPVGFARPSSRR
jgi:cell wall-associated NlpC family hydrolase